LEEPVKGLLLLASLASYQVPEGYSVSESENGADAAVTLVRGSHKLEIRLFGAPGSRYGSARGFLDSRAAASFGAPPRLLDAKRRDYERSYALPLGDPNAPAPSERVVQRFRVVPAGGTRFFVLSSAWESGAPDLDGASERAWRGLRDGFRVRTPASSGSRSRGR
jgi:hypothetical protein